MLFPFTLIDLTHDLSSDVPAWGTHDKFQLTTPLDYTDCTTDVKFRVQHINTPAGIGTHMDAPSHCVPGGKSVAELALENLLAPCVVIDVSAVVLPVLRSLDEVGTKADVSAVILTTCPTKPWRSRKADVSDRAHETYVVSQQDIQDFEKKHGTIAPGSFVIIRTGWDRFWKMPARYRNNLVFPSVSVEAARMLLDRNIVGLGIDTLSPDSARPSRQNASAGTTDFPIHQLLLSNGKYIVENVANSDKLPPVGSFSLALPMKIVGGTEAPVRLIGLIQKP